MAADCLSEARSVINAPYGRVLPGEKPRSYGAMITRLGTLRVG